MGDLSLHFSRSEMMCHCGCGECLVSPRLMSALEELRSFGPEPVIVHDAYRCVNHNIEVGGRPHSEHITGDAWDGTILGLSLQQQYERLMRIKVFAEGGIGVYSEGFVHGDVRTRRARWSRKKGVYLALSVLVKPTLGDVPSTSR